MLRICNLEIGRSRRYNSKLWQSRQFLVQFHSTRCKIALNKCLCMSRIQFGLVYSIQTFAIRCCRFRHFSYPFRTESFAWRIKARRLVEELFDSWSNRRRAFYFCSLSRLNNWIEEQVRKQSLFLQLSESEKQKLDCEVAILLFLFNWFVWEKVT